MGDKLSLEEELREIHTYESRSSNSKIQKHFLTPLLSKRIPKFKDSSEKKVWPQTVKNPIFYLFFWWLIPVLNIGYKRTLDNNDLFELKDNMKIEHLYATFKSYLEKEMENNKKKALKKNPILSEEELNESLLTNFTFIKCLFKTYKSTYFWVILWKLVSDCGTTCIPLLSKKLIAFVEKKAYARELGTSISMNKGVGYAFGCFLLIFLEGIATSQFMGLGTQCGIYSRTILTKLLLEKSFTVGSKSKGIYTSGRITSLLGTDLSRIDEAFLNLPFALTFPIPFVILIALLIYNIGVSALAGIAAFFILLMSFVILGVSLMRYRQLTSITTDARVSAIREVVGSIKMIKYYSWETPFHLLIKTFRLKETATLLKMQLLRSLILSLASGAPTLSSAIAFLVLHAVDPNRSVASIFSSVSIFGQLAYHVLMIPTSITFGTDAYLAAKRVTEFYAREDEKEIDLDWQLEQEKLTSFQFDEKSAIQLKNATFVWETLDKIDEDDKEADEKKTSKREPIEKEKPKGDPLIDETKIKGLNDLTMSIKKGEFIIVTGAIGSGKTSLLNAMAGFMRRTRGVLKINGELLLCGEPWIQNTTVKENILFTLPYEAERYEKIVEVCCLKDDFAIFPSGDMTEVGEKGITLSGGQKARISLARAVYKNPDIILLDDVLSAVDAKVGKFIMEDLILRYLQKKTRVLVTHQLNTLGHADRIIFFNKDNSATIGTFEELKKNDEFEELLSFSSYGREEDEQKKKETSINEIDARNVGNGALYVTNKKLVGEEERAVNKIQFRIYKEFFKLGGGRSPLFVSFALIFVCALATFCRLFTNTWLSFWTDNKFEGKSEGFYIGIYLMFCCLTVILTLVQLSFITYVFNRAARDLILKAIKNIFSAQMSFLDATPIGRIMNRFTKDTDALDNALSEQLGMFSYGVSTIIGVMILCIIYIPWMALTVPFIAFASVCLVSYYQASSREIKRLEATNRSFVYNNFEESLSGMSTIKAYKLQNVYISRNDEYIDRLNESSLMVNFVQRFLGVHADSLASLFLLIILLLCAGDVFHVSAASSGLIISYTLSALGLLAVVLNGMTEIENSMNSAERLIFYGFDLPKEETPEILAKYSKEPLDPDWLVNSADIEFNNVNFRYRDHLPLVLKNLSFTIKSGEKIGVCGRTGAGKSSIMSTIYRLKEIEDNGSIIIDGKDTATVPLKDLRSKLCIIPQDPVLFKGTIRSNLDPFSTTTDDVLWDALRRSHLIDGTKLTDIKNQRSTNDGNDTLDKFHLDQEVEENGKNFSLGERQLLALARALVRKSKILILDEATSSIDYSSDSKVNETIRNEFKDCSVLCIAHRLNTIISYDRIMVLEKGEIIEFDTPYELFKKNGVFRSMCNRSKISERDFK